MLHLTTGPQLSHATSSQPLRLWRARSRLKDCIFIIYSIPRRAAAEGLGFLAQLVAMAGVDTLILLL